LEILMPTDPRVSPERLEEILTALERANAERYSDAGDWLACEEAEAMARELLERREREDWRPIETAPHNGDEILAQTLEHGVTIICWQGDHGWRTSRKDETTPTHWRPRPAPPAEVVQGSVVTLKE
jgi:hypothetical protein